MSCWIEWEFSATFSSRKVKSVIDSSLCLIVWIESIITKQIYLLITCPRAFPLWPYKSPVRFIKAITSRLRLIERLGQHLTNGNSSFHASCEKGMRLYYCRRHTWSGMQCAVDLGGGPHHQHSVEKKRFIEGALRDAKIVSARKRCFLARRRNGPMQCTAWRRW